MTYRIERDIFAEDRKKIETKIFNLQKRYEPNFLITDIPLGILSAILCCGFLAWIPIIGWVAMPFALIIMPFCGPIIRKRTCLTQILKLRKKLDGLRMA